MTPIAVVPRVASSVVTERGSDVDKTWHLIGRGGNRSCEAILVKGSIICGELCETLQAMLRKSGYTFSTNITALLLTDVLDSAMYSSAHHDARGHVARGSHL